MTDPITQSKIDDLKNQLDAHRRVSNQSQERTRELLQRHKERFLAQASINQKAIEVQGKRVRLLVGVSGVLFILLLGLATYTATLVSSLNRLGVNHEELTTQFTSKSADVLKQLKALGREQTLTNKRLERTRRNMGVQSGERFKNVIPTDGKRQR